jgi:taurine dioxygenase
LFLTWYKIDYYSDGLIDNNKDLKLTGSERKNMTATIATPPALPFDAVPAGERTRKAPHFTITPTGGALGAIVTGLDVRNVAEPEEIFRLKRAHEENHILIFKEQRLAETDLVAFATLFGPIFRSEAHIPVAGWKEGITPDVVQFNNDPEAAEGERGSIGPHIDHKWTPYPSASSFLYAIVTPTRGGETSWTNLIRAYEELDDATTARIAGLRLHTYNGFVRAPGRFNPGYRVNADDPSEGPLFAHPLVRTHPSTGKKILFLDISSEVELIGIDPQEGAELIAQLREHLAQPRFTYEHRWEVGDIVWWDNQATQHARNDWLATEHRQLKRVSIGGGRPF